MVCSNCHSDKIIDVQGQRFCTNCGRLVETPEPAKQAVAASTAEGLPAGIQITPVPGVELPAAVKAASKRKVGRPKSGRLDVPTPQAVAAEAAPDPLVTPEPPATPLRHHGRRSLSDIAPGEARPAAAVAPTASVKAGVGPAAQKSHQRFKPAPIPPPAAAPIGYGEVASETWRERFHLRYLWLALVPAVFLGLVAGGVTLAMMAGRTPQALADTTLKAGWAVGGEALLVAALYYVGRSLGHSAILYGAARRSDHRPAPIGRWVGVAVNSFGRRLWFDIMTSLAQLVVVALAVGLIFTGGVDWAVPPVAQIAALYFAFLALVYLWAGLAITQGFGRVGLTLADISDRRAFGLGWGFFRRHFELVGFKLLGLVAELILIVPLAAAAIASVVYIPHHLVWLAALAMSAAVMVAGALIGAGAAVWWQATYRQLIHGERLAEAVNLLSGHQPEKPRTGALVSVTMLATLLVAAASLWPWLPWPSL